MRALGVIVLLLAPSLAMGARYQVGPDREIKEPSELAGKLAPGDVVEVDGDAVYRGLDLKRPGTKDKPIVWKGVRRRGKRPVLQGGTTDGKVTLHVRADWNTFEGFEIRDGSEVCVFNKAHGTVVRDALIHSCPRHGVLGSDDGSGSLTLSYVEVCNSGSERKGENLKHPVYVATDSKLHPDAVLRVEHSWIHGNNGGNNIKSRARRTEIYYNWLEGAQYYEVELLGPVSGLGAPREDADVVGNVFVNTSPQYVVRVGGDGTGSSEGRVRFVNNTFLMGPKALGVLRINAEIEAVELYNNAFVKVGGLDRFLRDSEAQWVHGRKISGSHNFFNQVASRIEDFPPELTNNVHAQDACVTDLSALDLRPREDSALVDAGTTKTRSALTPPGGLPLPAFVPGLSIAQAVGMGARRGVVGPPDLGAYEAGSPTGPLGRHPAFVAPPAKAPSAGQCRARMASGPDALEPGVEAQGPTRRVSVRTLVLLGGAAVAVLAAGLVLVEWYRARARA